MAGVAGVLLDIDGVLHVGDAPLPGAKEALARLREAGLPIRFVTNTTRRSRRMLRERLARLGFDIPEDALLTPAAAARRWLIERRAAPHLLIHPDLREDFAGIEEGEDAVVLGDAGDGFTYAALNRAFRLLMAGAPLLALAANRYFREPDGLSLDAGAFVAALEHASGTKAALFGKPAPRFWEAAVASLGCPPSAVVMIGDDVEADVNGAAAAGLRAILVRTGKFRPGDEARLAEGAEAAADLPEAVERLRGPGRRLSAPGR